MLSLSASCGLSGIKSLTNYHFVVIGLFAAFALADWLGRRSEFPDVRYWRTMGVVSAILYFTIATFAPPDWSFADYNSGEKDIEGFLRESKANRSAVPYGENRALLFHGLIFHQSAEAKFKPGFENRRRNVTMLFRKTRG